MSDGNNNEFATLPDIDEFLEVFSSAANNRRGGQYTRVVLTTSFQTFLQRAFPNQMPSDDYIARLWRYALNRGGINPDNNPGYGSPPPTNTQTPVAAYPPAFPHMTMVAGRNAFPAYPPPSWQYLPGPFFVPMQQPIFTSPTHHHPYMNYASIPQPIGNQELAGSSLNVNTESSSQVSPMTSVGDQSTRHSDARKRYAPHPTYTTIFPTLEQAMQHFENKFQCCKRHTFKKCNWNYLRGSKYRTRNLRCCSERPLVRFRPNSDGLYETCFSITGGTSSGSSSLSHFFPREQTMDVNSREFRAAQAQIKACIVDILTTQFQDEIPSEIQIFCHLSLELSQRAVDGNWRLHWFLSEAGHQTTYTIIRNLREAHMRHHAQSNSRISYEGTAPNGTSHFVREFVQRHSLDMVISDDVQPMTPFTSYQEFLDHYNLTSDQLLTLPVSTDVLSQQRNEFSAQQANDALTTIVFLTPRHLFNVYLLCTSPTHRDTTVLYTDGKMKILRASRKSTSLITFSFLDVDIHPPNVYVTRSTIPFCHFIAVSENSASVYVAAHLFKSYFEKMFGIGLRIHHFVSDMSKGLLRGIRLAYPCIDYSACDEHIRALTTKSWKHRIHNASNRRLIAFDFTLLSKLRGNVNFKNGWLIALQRWETTLREANFVAFLRGQANTADSARTVPFNYTSSSRCGFPSSNQSKERYWLYLTGSPKQQIQGICRFDVGLENFLKNSIPRLLEFDGTLFDRMKIGHFSSPLKEFHQTPPEVVALSCLYDFGKDVSRIAPGEFLVNGPSRIGQTIMERDIISYHDNQNNLLNENNLPNCGLLRYSQTTTSFCHLKTKDQWDMDPLYSQYFNTVQGCKVKYLCLCDMFHSRLICPASLFLSDHQGALDNEPSLKQLITITHEGRPNNVRNPSRRRYRNTGVTSNLSTTIFSHFGLPASSTASLPALMYISRLRPSSLVRVCRMRSPRFRLGERSKLDLIQTIVAGTSLGESMCTIAAQNVPQQWQYQHHSALNPHREPSRRTTSHILSDPFFFDPYPEGIDSECPEDCVTYFIPIAEEGRELYRVNIFITMVTCQYHVNALVTVHEISRLFHDHHSLYKSLVDQHLQRGQQVRSHLESKVLPESTTVEPESYYTIPTDEEEAKVVFSYVIERLLHSPGLTLCSCTLLFFYEYLSIQRYIVEQDADDPGDISLEFHVLDSRRVSYQDQETTRSRMTRTICHGPKSLADFLIRKWHIHRNSSHPMSDNSLRVVTYSTNVSDVTGWRSGVGIDSDTLYDQDGDLGMRLKDVVEQNLLTFSDGPMPFSMPVFTDNFYQDGNDNSVLLSDVSHDSLSHNMGQDVEPDNTSTNAATGGRPAQPQVYLETNPDHSNVEDGDIESPLERIDQLNEVVYVEASDVTPRSRTSIGPTHGPWESIPTETRCCLGELMSRPSDRASSNQNIHSWASSCCSHTPNHFPSGTIYRQSELVDKFKYWIDPIAQIKVKHVRKLRPGISKRWDIILLEALNSIHIVHEHHRSPIYVNHYIPAPVVRDILGSPHGTDDSNRQWEHLYRERKEEILMLCQECCVNKGGTGRTRTNPHSPEIVYYVIPYIPFNSGIHPTLFIFVTTSGHERVVMINTGKDSRTVRQQMTTVFEQLSGILNDLLPEQSEQNRWKSNISYRFLERMVSDADLYMSLLVMKVSEQIPISDVEKFAMSIVGLHIDSYKAYCWLCLLHNHPAPWDQMVPQGVMVPLIRQHDTAAQLSVQEEEVIPNSSGDESTPAVCCLDVCDLPEQHREGPFVKGTNCSHILCRNCARRWITVQSATWKTAYEGNKIWRQCCPSCRTSWNWMYEDILPQENSDDYLNSDVYGYHRFSMPTAPSLFTVPITDHHVWKGLYGICSSPLRPLDVGYLQDVPVSNQSAEQLEIRVQEHITYEIGKVKKKCTICNRTKAFSLLLRNRSCCYPRSGGRCNAYLCKLCVKSLIENTTNGRAQCPGNGCSSNDTFVNVINQSEYLLDGQVSGHQSEREQIVEIH